MASIADAELILKLYEIRREPLNREAREWLAMQFNPTTIDDVIALQRSMGTRENAFWRQVLSYWEMAVSFVNRGVLDADMFNDANGEHIFLYAKFAAFHADYERMTGSQFMPQMTKLVAAHAPTRERLERMVKMFETRRQQAQPTT